MWCCSSVSSVGAAGDLLLAHIARAAGYAARPASITPYRPSSKEALALINGISMTAALGAVAAVRVRRVLDAAIAAAAMTMEAVGAGADCIDDRVVRARRHPGGIEVATRLRAWLKGSDQVRSDRGANAFSIRATPAVMGTLVDELSATETVLERELNGAGDNPLLMDAERLKAATFTAHPSPKRSIRSRRPWRSWPRFRAADLPLDLWATVERTAIVSRPRNGPQQRIHADAVHCGFVGERVQGVGSPYPWTPFPRCSTMRITPAWGPCGAHAAGNGRVRLTSLASNCCSPPKH